MQHGVTQQLAVTQAMQPPTQYNSKSAAQKVVWCLHCITDHLLWDGWANVRLPCSISYSVELPVHRQTKTGQFGPVQVLAVQL